MALVVRAELALERGHPAHAGRFVCRQAVLDSLHRRTDGARLAVRRRRLVTVGRQLGLDDRDPEVIKQMHATTRAYLNALPDVQTFVRNLGIKSKHHVTPDRMLRGPSRSRFAAANIPLEPIYTIGGRLCFVENSTIDEEGDVVQSFAYKLLNTTIQGGAADMLLEAIIAIDELTDEPLTLTAHDQVLQSVPYRRAKTYARHVSHIMENVVPERLFCPETVVGSGDSVARGLAHRFDVPLITDTKIKKRWQE